MNPRSVLARTLLATALTAVAATAFAGNAGTAVPVASIAAVGGQVLLAQGADVAPAAAGAALYPGDRLMTLDGAEALIAFEAGCQRRLEGDSLLTIGDRADCAEPHLVAFRQAIGETGGAAKEEDDDDREAAMIVDANNASGTTVTRLTPGQRWAVAAALLIPALYYWDRNRDDDDDRPPVSR